MHSILKSTLVLLFATLPVFGQVEDFDSIKLYTLKNSSGMTVKVTNCSAHGGRPS